MAVGLAIWAAIEFDPRDKRRIKRYIALHSNDEKITDEVEMFVAERISKIFFTNKVSTDDLRPTMNISNLYKIDNKKAVLDDMEYEQLVMDVEDKFEIKIIENEIADFGTIRDFSNFIKSRLKSRCTRGT